MNKRRRFKAKRKRRQYRQYKIMHCVYVQYRMGNL